MKIRARVSSCLVVVAAAAFSVSAFAKDKDASPDAASKPAASWQVGFAQAEITPPPGHAMMAGFGRERYAEGTLSPLRAQVLAFQDAAGRRALLCTADVLGFGPDSVMSLRHRLGKAHKIQPSAVCLSASHTHWGPAINSRTNPSIGSTNIWYLAFLEETILRLADEAIRDLAPAAIDYESCEAQIGMCRRTIQPDGRVDWGPNPKSFYDRHTPVIRVTRQKSPKQLLLVTHGCHPTSMGNVDKWSPDYPGAMRDRLEAKLDDTKALFAMGCGGDAKVVYKNPKTNRDEFVSDPDRCREAGEKLADAVMQQLGTKRISLAPTLTTTHVKGPLSFAEPYSREQLIEKAMSNLRTYDTWWARYSLTHPDPRRALDYEVQVWRLGSLAMVALEGEVCADWGRFVREMAPAESVMVVGYANACEGYIPTARIIREGGYEGGYSHAAYFLPAPFQTKMEDELRALVLRGLRGDAK